MTEKYAVIVAGGKGTRAGGGVPKQFREVAGKPMIWWSLKAFQAEDPHVRIVLVLPSDAISFWQDLHSGLPEQVAHVCVAGGASRTESVRAGLAAIPEAAGGLVAVHDAARPLVTPALISRGWAAALASGAAVPVVPVADSLRHLVPSGSEAVDRAQFVAVQTPQVFSLPLLREAYSGMREGSFTDDASVAEAFGVMPVLYEGDPDNFKVTNPGDFIRAQILLSQRGDA